MRLAFTDVGSGPAVVLIHGLGGSREIFTELMAALGSGVRCVAIDLPDMGESGAWASQSPGEIAVALQTFLRSRGIERAVVVGHSYGGLTAMEFAARFPSAVKALFVIASPAMGLPASMRTLVSGLVPQMNRFKRVTTRVVASRRGMRAFLIWLSGRLKSPAPHLVARYVAANSSPGILEALSGGLRAISAFTPPVEAIVNSALPVQLIWGARDPLVSLRDGQRLAHALGVELQVLAEAGHCVPEDAAEAVAALIARAHQ